MERKVFCLIPPRRKAIKLGAQLSDVFDVDILRTAFSQACESDPILKTLTYNKMMVFQLRDETGEWCDMEPDDKLENLIEINVVTISKMDNATEIISSTKAISELQPGEVLPLDLNVIYSETSKNINIDPLADELDNGHTKSDANTDDEKPCVVSFKFNVTTFL